LFICTGGALASPGSVVFNSFKDRTLALKESALISRQFGIEARIEEAGSMDRLTIEYWARVWISLLLENSFVRRGQVG